MKRYYGQPDPTAGSDGRRIRLTRNGKVALGAVAVVAALGALMIAVGSDPQPETTRMLWIAEKTTRAPGSIPEAVRQRAVELSSVGGGEFTAYAVGSRARKVKSVSLDVTMDGDRVKDVGKQRQAVNRRLTTVAAELAKAQVGDQGFSLYEALRIGADEVAKSDGPVEMWLSTTVFSGSTDPLSIAELTGADPSQAVDELMKGSLRDLRLQSVDLHIVALTPVGDGQEALTPRSESWRNTFIAKLCRRLGAEVSDPVHDDSTDNAWPKSSVVPPIEPLDDPPPRPPPPPAAGEPSAPRIDNAAFVPDTAELIDPAAAHDSVRQIVDAYHASPGKYLVKVTGYCARFGDRDGAITTSKARADAIAALLEADGVVEGDLSVKGVGFDELAETTKDPRSPAQRVVIIQLIART